MKITKQLQSWQSDFGKEYTDRSSLSIEEMDTELGDYTGIKKSDVFRRFIPADILAPGAKVLEVGCNVAIQLRLLQKLNPGWSFFGVDPMEYALSKAGEVAPDMTFAQAAAGQLPFADGEFDLVMTNSVLIHIHPEDLSEALAEIYRCSDRYIFLHEYYSETTQEVRYRGNEGLLWRQDFAGRYLELFPGLKVVAVDYLDYKDPRTGEPLRDQVCLVEKPRQGTEG